MARPRELVLEHGTVVLKGFPKEEADRICELLKPSKPSLDSKPEVPLSSLKEKALSIHLDRANLIAEVVTIAYDRETCACKVESVVKAENVTDAVMKYKIASAKLNFV